MPETDPNNSPLIVEKQPLMFLNQNATTKNTATETVFNKTVENSVPKATEGLTEKGPTPFLKKTYEMVDDPKTDSIISWSETKNSFVVWDRFKFQTDLLPKHFKHDKFSTFVRQLNNYGFRKVNHDRWEYANESFQQGKKHLLKCIKGRDCYRTRQQQGEAKYPIDNTKHKNEAELENLRAYYRILRTKVVQLRQQEKSTQQYLAAVNDRLHSAEQKQKQALLFMKKSFTNPTFLQNFVKKMDTKQRLCDDRVSEKKRLPTPEVDDGMVAMRASDINSVDDNRMQDQEELATIQSEIQILKESGSPQEREAENLEMNSANVCSELYVLWKKLMEDDMINNEEAKSDGQQQTTMPMSV